MNDAAKIQDCIAIRSCFRPLSTRHMLYEGCLVLLHWSQGAPSETLRVCMRARSGRSSHEVHRMTREYASSPIDTSMNGWTIMQNLPPRPRSDGGTRQSLVTNGQISAFAARPRAANT